jgi:uncharacterized membrane protein
LARKKSSRRNTKKKQSHFHRPNFWGMIQNVLIAGMNKGQLLPAAIALVVILWVLKADADTVGQTLSKTVSDTWYLGWILLIISLAFWAFSTKELRKTHSREIDRMAEEKKNLQEKLLRKK